MTSQSQTYEQLDASSPLAQLNTDQAITKVGGMGTYQIISLIVSASIFSLIGRITYGLSYLQDTQNISIYCTTPQNVTSECDKATACNADLTASYFFDTDSGRNNFITQVPELLCYSDASIALQGTTYFIGFTVGALVWMRLTDFWGRKRMIVGGVILFTITLMVYLVKMSLETIYATLFIFGLTAPAVLIAFILQIQSVSPKYRACASIAIHFFDSFSLIMLPLVYQFGKDWWIVFWISLGFSILSFFPLLFFMRESPKFYVSVRKFDQARKVYKYIAKVNRKPMFTNKLEGEERMEGSEDVGQNEHRIRELFRIRSLRKPLIVVPLIWFAVAYIDYGLTFSLGKLQGSIYMNGYFYGAAKVGSQPIAGVIVNGLGRKKSLILLFFLVGLACFLYEPLKSLGTVPTYICLVVEAVGTSWIFTALYLVTSQAFPTAYRGTVFGIGYVMARVGGILAPVISSLAKDNFMYIFGALAVCTGLVCFLLSETKGQVMTDTVEQERRKSLLGSEVENLGLNKSSEIKLKEGVDLKAESFLKDDQ